MSFKSYFCRTRSPIFDNDRKFPVETEIEDTNLENKAASKENKSDNMCSTKDCADQNSMSENEKFGQINTDEKKEPLEITSDDNIFVFLI